MNSNFDMAFDVLMKVEGGLVDDPRDLGGLTKFGISKKAYPNLDIESLTLEQAKEIYKKDYWNKCKCDDLPPSFDIAVFDTAVNMGPGKAIMLLQKAVREKVDGVLGEKTLAAANKSGQDELRRLLLYRLFDYSQQHGYSYYKNGWFDRLLVISGVI